VGLRECIPCEFIRRPRSVAEIDRWKATEFRQFLLYTGPVVLPGILPDTVYNHFLIFSVAMTLLISPEFCVTYSDYADSLIKSFVEQAKNLYGDDFIVYNVHGLTHLAADVRRFGSLDCFSAFPFENKLKDLKRLVRKPGYPMAQVIRRLSEERTAFSESRSTETGRVLTFEHSDGPVPDGYEEAVQFVNLKTVNYKLSLKTSADCYVLVKNVGPVKVVNILSLSGEIYIVHRSFKHVDDFFQYPLPSSSIGMYKVSGCAKNFAVCAFRDVLSKCLFFPLSSVPTMQKCYAVIPVVHTVIEERT